MTNRIFNDKEMENMFEIGRTMQAMEDNEEIEIEDSKEAFMFAMQLAVGFEKEYPDTEEYYLDLDEYVIDKILDRFGVEN